MADASVGVAIPEIIDPRTRIISINGRASVFKISDDDADLAFGKNSISIFLLFL